MPITETTTTVEQAAAQLIRQAIADIEAHGLYRGSYHGHGVDVCELRCDEDAEQECVPLDTAPVCGYAAVLRARWGRRAIYDIATLTCDPATRVAAAALDKAAERELGPMTGVRHWPYYQDNRDITDAEVLATMTLTADRLDAKVGGDDA